MALIKCPECGKEVSDQAEVCMNCGHPIQKWIKKNKKEFSDLVNPESNNENDTKNSTYSENNEAVVSRTGLGQNKRKRMIVFCSIAALIVIVCIAMFLFQQPQTQIPKFNLNSSMSEEQIINRLKSDGFTFDEERYQNDKILAFYVTQNVKVLGIRPTGIQVIKNRFETTETIYLGFYFQSEASDTIGLRTAFPQCAFYADLQGIYNTINNNAEKLLGQPTETTQKSKAWREPNVLYWLEKGEEWICFSYEWTDQSQNY